MSLATVRLPFVLLLFLGVAGDRAAGAAEPAAQPEVAVLLTQPLDGQFTPGREVAVHLVAIPPNAALDRHWHPGEEFHYYLEGEVEIRIDGEPSIFGKPGGVGHVPYKKLHTAIAGKDGAKILVFRVHSQGAPWRYLENEGAPAP